jgi:DNA-binding SARP family transcriptional activator
MGLMLQLFGEFKAHRNGTPVEFLYKGRNGAILAYLLLRHDRPPKVTEVADLFWAEYSDADACLRTWCKRLRDAVGETLDVRTIGGAVHLIRKEADVDVVAFDTLIERGEQGELQALRQAVALYRRGPLLSGWEDAWVEAAREARTPRYLEALRTLAAHAFEAGHHAEARKYQAARVHHLLQALRANPQHEAGWCDLMEALMQAGERIEAMEIYRKCQDYFQRRQLSPPHCMTALYRELQQAVSAAPPLHPDALESEPIGGAVPLHSRFYVVRLADAVFHAALARRDCIVCLKGPGQIGKTSLLARGLEQARQSGARTALTDFRKFRAAELETMEACCLALAQSLADQLELDSSPRAAWDPERAAGDNFERFLRREVLRKGNAPFVWGLDEVDRLFHHAYKDDVFGLFRAWHNERSLDPAGPWQRLTLILTYATEAYLLIADLNRSPFNVGAQVTLDDLNIGQVADLNQRYGAPLRDAGEVERFYNLVGGHPYLVRRGLQEMQARGMDFPALEAEADGEMGLYGSHLERLFVFLSLDAESQDAALVEAVRGVLRGEPCPSPHSFYRLRSAGVFVGASAREAALRCRLYENFLRRRLS